MVFGDFVHNFSFHKNSNIYTCQIILVFLATGQVREFMCLIIYSDLMIELLDISGTIFQPVLNEYCFQYQKLKLSLKLRSVH